MATDEGLRGQQRRWMSEAVAAGEYTEHGWEPPELAGMGPALARAASAAGAVGADYARLESEDGQRYESHVCQWEATAWRGALGVEYRCRLRWSDGSACDSTTAFPADLRRTERLASGTSATEIRW